MIIFILERILQHMNVWKAQCLKMSEEDWLSLLEQRINNRMFRWCFGWICMRRISSGQRKKRPQNHISFRIAFKKEEPLVESAKIDACNFEPLLLYFPCIINCFYVRDLMINYVWYNSLTAWISTGWMPKKEPADCMTESDSLWSRPIAWPSSCAAVLTIRVCV